MCSDVKTEFVALKLLLFSSRDMFATTQSQDSIVIEGILIETLLLN